MQNHGLNQWAPLCILTLLLKVALAYRHVQDTLRGPLGSFLVLHVDAWFVILDFVITGMAKAS